MAPSSIISHLRSKPKHQAPTKARSRGTLIQWGPQQNEFLLLAIDHACKQQGIRIPWTAVGNLFTEGTGEDPPTESAIQQHLGRTRNKRLNDGLACPAPTRIRSRPTNVLGPMKNCVSKSGLRRLPIGHGKKRAVGVRGRDPDEASDMDDEYVVEGGANQKKKSKDRGPKKRGRIQGQANIKKENSDDDTISGPGSEGDEKGDEGANLDSASGSPVDVAPTSSGANPSRMVTLHLGPKLRPFADQDTGVDNKSVNAQGWAPAPDHSYQPPLNQIFQSQRDPTFGQFQWNSTKPAVANYDIAQYASPPLFQFDQNSNGYPMTFQSQTFPSQTFTAGTHAYASPMTNQSYGFGSDYTATGSSHSSALSQTKTEHPQEAESTPNMMDSLDLGVGSGDFLNETTNDGNETYYWD